MKRTLAAAGAASAQLSATLFGVMDATSRYASTSRDPVTGASRKVSQTAQATSCYNASRLGFRGTEDPGGGLAASFWLEAQLSNDNGGAGAPGVTNELFNRRSTVSLSGGFGEVRLGRDEGHRDRPLRHPWRRHQLDLRGE
jgi:predicted porin